MALSSRLILLSLLVVLLLLVSDAHAFGAGEIPSYSAASKRAYRHGTIEQVLETIAKVSSKKHGLDVGHLVKGAMGALLTGSGGDLGSLVKGGGKTFSGLDVKRVYFGNWMRDYSQALDIAGLSKLSAESILLLIMCLSFMTFGYATEEFEVTKENLGVYLCTEHIDNPKGYGEGQDARKYDPRLRPPVEDRELEINTQNGMKNYIATEGQGYDTSFACIRRHLEKSIQLGRSGSEKDKYAAYREMGTALHTLEDFLAHSNYLELALMKLGNRNVFCHVGDNVRVRAPSGESVPPIVTGTFGSSDFMVSVLGEVGDKLSSSTVDDLTSKFNDAKTQDNQGGSTLLKTLLAKIPSGNRSDSGGSNVDSQIQNIEQIKQNAININPDQIATEEVQRIFIQVLTARDSIFKSIESTLETLGLDDLIEELSNALTVLVLTTIAPYMEPLIKTVTEGVTAGSEHILKQEDQLIVFNDDNASDPTHSVLSKDHFDLWLNEPAGLVAIQVVKHSVPLIVDAWSDESADTKQIIDTILQAIHHPYFARGDSPIQKQMLDTVEQWLNGLDRSQRDTILRSLTKDSVKSGNNKREDSDSYGTLGHRCNGHSHAAGAGRISGQAQQTYGQGQQSHQQSYGTSNSNYGRQNENSSYGSQQSLSETHASSGGRYQSTHSQQQQSHTTSSISHEIEQNRPQYGSEARYGDHSTANKYNQEAQTQYGGAGSGVGGIAAGFGSLGSGTAYESESGRTHQQQAYGGGSAHTQQQYHQSSGISGRRHDEQRPQYGRNDDEDTPHFGGGGRRPDFDGEPGRRFGAGRDDDNEGSRFSQGRPHGSGYGGRPSFEDDTSSRFGQMNLGGRENNNRFDGGREDDERRGGGPGRFGGPSAHGGPGGFGDGPGFGGPGGFGGGPFGGREGFGGPGQFGGRNDGFDNERRGGPGGGRFNDEGPGGGRHHGGGRNW